MDLTAAADDKRRTDALVSVQLLDLRRYLGRHLIHHRLRQLPHILRRNRMLDHHNVLVSHLIFHAARELDMLRRVEIHQITLHDQLGNLIPRKRNHTVRDDTSISRHRNIGRSRTDIHERNIQESVILRNRHIDRRNRLQRHVCHGQSRHTDCRIQTVHNILRQERHDDILADPLCLMGFQAGERFII